LVNDQQAHHVMLYIQAIGRKEGSEDIVYLPINELMQSANHLTKYHSC
jgi:hypothetical protein